MQLKNLHFNIAIKRVYDYAQNGCVKLVNPFTACNVNGYPLLIHYNGGNYARMNNLRAQMIIARLCPWIPDLAYRDTYA